MASKMTNTKPSHPLMSWLWQAPWILLALWLGWHVLDWGVLRAVFRPDWQACQALAHEGACWGVVVAKGSSWLFGRYPETQWWRPALTLALWGAGLGLALWALLRTGSTHQAGQQAGHRSGLGRSVYLLITALLWLAGLALMAGGWPLSATGLDLPAVPSAQWGGLPLTLMLTVGSVLFSLPLALLLAWGRLSNKAWWAWPATAVIEVVRGAPLVMWLFAAAFVLPALLSAILPQGWELGPVLRVLLVTTLFSAAYAAEILRGSLRVVAQEQAEAAQVLGANWWVQQSRVILPQAFRSALPALTSHTIGVLKDTALVMVVSLQDLTGAMSMSLNGDADWRPYFLEAYLVIALAYALMCLGVAALGRTLERRYPALGAGQ